MITEQLAELASEAVGRPIAVVLRNLAPIEAWGQADSQAGELRLDGTMLATRGVRDACHVFVHEVYHLLHSHEEQRSDFEEAADAFADEVIERAGVTWFAWAAKGAMTQGERAKVLGAIAEVAGSRRGIERQYAEPSDDMDRGYDKFMREVALFKKWDAKGMHPEHRKLMVHRLRNFGKCLLGEEPLPAVREFIHRPITASKDGLIHG